MLRSAARLIVLLLPLPSLGLAFQPSGYFFVMPVGILQRWLRLTLLIGEMW